MRQLAPGKVLAVRAIGGLHVVTLAWDFVDGQKAIRDGFLGFALERSQLNHGVVVETYFPERYQAASSQKTRACRPERPFRPRITRQSFQWGDYTAAPAHLSGTEWCRHTANLVRSRSTTHRPDDRGDHDRGGGERPVGAGLPAHDVYFNRGVAGSQAYARKIRTGATGPTKPQSAQMEWLSRGCSRRLSASSGRAAGPDAKDYGLRACFYEFRYLPVGQAFAAASKAWRRTCRSRMNNLQVGQSDDRPGRYRRDLPPQKVRSDLRTTS